MKKHFFLVFALIFALPVYSNARCQPDAFPSLTFDPENVFPKTKNLKRPEDGRALPDGRVVVADDEHGLRVIAKDGTHRPFGKFKEAGYKNEPPESPGAPNGLFLEQDGRHLLVADVYTGHIYRVDTQTESTRLIYRHEYGVNSLLRDSRETIWFTQSARNNLRTGSQALYAAINKPVNSGAVFMLPGSGSDINAKAIFVADGLYLANGVAINKAEDRLYVAETMMDRVLVFDIDRKNLALKNRRTYATVLGPDNLIVDSKNNLFIASAISNSVYAVDAKCESLHRVFSAPSEGNRKAQDSWSANLRTGQPLISVISPATFEPLPGILTGMFFSADEKTFYVTGLGNAILRYNF